MGIPIKPSRYLIAKGAIAIKKGGHAQYAVTFNGAVWDFEAFFLKSRIGVVLSGITLVWRYLKDNHPEPYPSPARPKYPQADKWRQFVARAMREENLAYSVDELCGVHFLVDEEFERNRVSALRATDAPRYANVRASFESAHSYLDAQPPDPKASVRAMFEALEVLTRLMIPASKNLSRYVVEKHLTPMVLATIADHTEKQATQNVLVGLADWVDGIHFYRHGQGLPDPVAPSLSFAVYALSSGAAALRLLLGIDVLITSGEVPPGPGQS